MICINENEKFNMHEEDLDIINMARRINKAIRRKGRKQNCAICGDDWFVADMLPYNDKLICKFCNLKI